jgi:ferric-dicitrate binding protein FerR (iron transport regulator)
LAVAARNQEFVHNTGGKLMISKTWSRKPIAALVAVAILSVYSMVVLASPAAKAPSGELSIAGQVMVNGETAVSGGTFFSESIITTAEKSNATVSLSKMGRVELLPSSNLKLSFTDKSITGLLDNGTARVSTVAGTSVNFTTKDGIVVVDGSQATSFTVNVVKGITYMTTHSGVAQLRVGSTVKQVAAGESATAGTPVPDTGDDDDDMSSGELAALLLLGAGAVAGILYAAMHNNDLNFGGTVVVISPAK